MKRWSPFRSFSRRVRLASDHRNRFDLWVFLVAFCAVGTALWIENKWVKKWVDSDGRPELRQLAFSYAKFLLVFFLAGQAMNFIFRINREATDKRKLQILFGLDRKGSNDTVLFVLPVFDANNTTLELRRDTRNSKRKFRVPPTVEKVLRDSLGGTFVRYDVQTAMELATLIGDAGVRDFMVIDDRTFLRELADQQDHESQFTVRRGDTPVRVGTVVCIGLWSNMLTDLLSRSSAYPEFSMESLKSDSTVDGKEGFPESTRFLHLGLMPPLSIRVTSNQSDAVDVPGRKVVSATRQGGDLDYTGSEGEDLQPALISIRRYREFTFALLGGVNAYGTLRVGDFLLRDDGLDQIFEAMNESRNEDVDSFVALLMGRGLGKTRRSYLHQLGSGIGTPSRTSGSASFTNLFRQSAIEVVGDPDEKPGSSEAGSGSSPEPVG